MERASSLLHLPGAGTPETKGYTSDSEHDGEDDAHPDNGATPRLLGRPWRAALDWTSAAAGTAALAIHPRPGSTVVREGSE